MLRKLVISIRNDFQDTWKWTLGTILVIHSIISTEILHVLAIRESGVDLREMQMQIMSIGLFAAFMMITCRALWQKATRYTVAHAALIIMTALVFGAGYIMYLSADAFVSTIILAIFFNMVFWRLGKVAFGIVRTKIKPKLAKRRKFKEKNSRRKK